MASFTLTPTLRCAVASHACPAVHALAPPFLALPHHEQAIAVYHYEQMTSPLMLETAGPLLAIGAACVMAERMAMGDTQSPPLALIACVSERIVCTWLVAAGGDDGALHMLLTRSLSLPHEECTSTEARLAVSAGGRWLFVTVEDGRYVLEFDCARRELTLFRSEPCAARVSACTIGGRPMVHGPMAPAPGDEPERCCSGGAASAPACTAAEEREALLLCAREDRAFELWLLSAGRGAKLIAEHAMPPSASQLSAAALHPCAPQLLLGEASGRLDVFQLGFSEGKHSGLACTCHCTLTVDVSKHGKRLSSCAPCSDVAELGVPLIGLSYVRLPERGCTAPVGSEACAYGVAVLTPTTVLLVRIGSWDVEEMVETSAASNWGETAASATLGGEGDVFTGVRGAPFLLARSSAFEPLVHRHRWQWRGKRFAFSLRHSPRTKWVKWRNGGSFSRTAQAAGTRTSSIASSASMARMGS